MPLEKDALTLIVEIKELQADMDRQVRIREVAAHKFEHDGRRLDVLRTALRKIVKPEKTYDVRPGKEVEGYG